MHIQAIELNKYRVDQAQNNQAFRIQYMLNDLTDDEFKSKIQRKEKERQKYQDLYDILQMVHTTGAMYMRELSEIDITLPRPEGHTPRYGIHGYAYNRQPVVNKNIKLPSRVDEIVNELNELKTYANKVMSDVSLRYSKCKTPRISENWETVD